jgi:hypothetical protein
LTKGKIGDAIKQLDKILDPKKAVPFVKAIIKTAKSIVKIMANIVKYISLLQLVIRIGLLLLKIFYKLRYFFFGIPVPEAFNTVGIQTGISAAYEDVINTNGIGYFLKRISQIKSTKMMFTTNVGNQGVIRATRNNLRSMSFR